MRFRENILSEYHKEFQVLFITNIGQLEEGEELIVEVAPKEKLNKTRARTWRQVEQAEQTQKSPAKSPKQK